MKRRAQRSFPSQGQSFTHLNDSFVLFLAWPAKKVLQNKLSIHEKSQRGVRTSLKLYCSWKIYNIKSSNGGKRKIKFNGYFFIETNIRRASLTFVSEAKSKLQVLRWVYLFDNFRSKREFFTTFPAIKILNAGLLTCFKLYSGK